MSANADTATSAEPSPRLREPPQDEISLLALSALVRMCGMELDPGATAHELGLQGRAATERDVIRAAALCGVTMRRSVDEPRTALSRLRRPALLRRAGGHYVVVLPVPRRRRTFLVIDPAQSGRARPPERVRLEQLCTGADVELLVIIKVEGRDRQAMAFGLAWFVPTLWRYRKALAHVLVASCFVQLFALVTPLFFQIVVDKVLVHKAMATLIVVSVGLVVLGLFDVTLQYLRSYALAHTANRIDVELGARLFRHLFRLPLAYFETRPTGQTVARVRELESVRSFFTGQGLTALIDLAFTVVFLVVLLLYSARLTLVVALSIPLYVLIAVGFRPILRHKLMQKYNKGAESQQLLVEAVVGAHTIKAAAVEPLIEGQWAEKLAAYVAASFEALMVATAGQNSIQYLGKLTNAAILFLGAQQVIANQLTVGQLIAFNMLAAQVFSPILRLSQLWQDFQQVQVSIERLGDIFSSAPEPQPLIALQLQPMRGSIRLHDVHFRYGPASPQVLKGISLDMHAGQTVGIVGPSGSGKSTVAKLIQRLYVPERGRILIDGVDLAQAPLAWVRGQMGVVLQENLLFNRTVRENIALTSPYLGADAVVEAARLAGADEFIREMPQGYDSQIVERGANLSGGQRQRIAIARALVRDPRILIFDEATSALDYESERIIQANMKEIARGRTVIIIAHRLAAVRECDRIIGIVDGVIVEDGRHDELVARRGGLYARLWALQMGLESA